MPSIRDAGSLQSAKMFCEDFLNAGGLNMVVNVLQKYAIPTEVDYETRQGCYSTALQLLGYDLSSTNFIKEKNPKKINEQTKALK